MVRLHTNISRRLNRPMRITCDDVKHLILVDGRKVSLSPKQYQIFRSFFLEKGGEYNTAQRLKIVFFVTKKRLRSSVHISEVALRKQISNLNSRLRPYGIQIQTLRDGYILMITEQAQYQAD
jgi:biotin operon repressor